MQTTKMFICILLALSLVPTSQGRILESSPIQEIGENIKRPREKDTTKVLLPSLNIRNAPSEVIEIMVGKNKVLECEAGGNPPPTIHWLKDGKRIAQSMYEVLHPSANENGAVAPKLGLSFTRSKLFVDCATASDSGSYTCVAENTYSRKSKTSQLFVVGLEEDNAICLAKKSFGSPARIHMWTHSRLELIGSDVQLFCRPEGEPQPEVMWFGPNNMPVVDPQKYQIMANGDLIIRNIRWEDMGGYTCEVKNSEGSDDILTFLYPTKSENKETTKG